MPILLVTGNLNTFGNNGQFETDPSTWGFAGGVRSNEQAYAGIYALKFTASTLLSGGNPIQKIAFGNYAGIGGKKYTARARIRVNGALPVGDGGIDFKIGAETRFALVGGILTGFTHFHLTVVTQKTVTEGTDVWVDLETTWTHNASGSPSFYVGMTGNYSFGENLIPGGVAYVDKFEIYEFIEVDDEGEPLPDPDPDVTDTSYHSKNPITLAIVAPEGWTEETNYRLYCDVRVEDVADSGVYNSKLKQELPPTTGGEAIFYLNEAFRDAFEFNPPALNDNNIQRLTDRIKRFKNFTGALIETETDPDEVTEGSTHLVLYGGVSKFHWPTLDYLTTYLATNKKFLSWAPVQKYVDRLQEDYLNFWIYDESIVLIKLYIKGYYDDGTFETGVTTTKAVTYKALYQVPAGPVNSFATLLQPSKNLTHYELSLLNQADELISEVRSYYIASFHPLARHLMFLNSLGAYEVLRFTGQLETKTEFVREVVQKFLPHDYSPSSGEFSNENNIIQAKSNYSSGFIKGRLAKQWHEYMQDFLNSAHIYDVTDGLRIQINITSGEWNYADQLYERFIRFDARKSYDDQSFTPATV